MRVLGRVLAAALVGVCAHGGCGDPAMATMITLGSLGASSGVSAAGAAYPRHGSVPGAFVGGAAATALITGAWLLVLELHAGESGDNQLLGPLLVASALLIPSLGATIGYEVFRDRSRDTPIPAPPAMALTVQTVGF